MGNGTKFLVDTENKEHPGPSNGNSQHLYVGLTEAATTSAGYGTEATKCTKYVIPSSKQ